ncbi:MAG: Rieske 2Fe-2S domain-containing protein [Chloroflexi bacterium]|nr:Rieske 2Fe-2S domain-containing protein [Chloroflexota bacterium]
MAHSVPLSSGDISRRRVLATGVFGLGGVIGLVYVVAILRFIIPAGRSGSSLEKVGTVNSFTTEVPKRVPLGLTNGNTEPTGGAWIIKHSAQSYTAFDMHCTHLSCPYNWTGDNSPNGVFACPCHGSVFSKTGAVINGPAFIPLHKREVQAKGTEVLVGGIIS